MAERDFGYEAQQAAERHMERILTEYDEGTANAYCGCVTCLVREVLEAAWPAIDAYCEDAGAPPLARALAICPTGEVVHQLPPVWPTDDIPPDDVLPCGCILRCAIVAGVKTLTVIPCRVGCTNFQATVGLAEESDVPITYRNAP